MANLKSYIDAPLFYDDTELSAALVNILSNNSELLKNASVMPSPAFDINRTLTTQNSLDFWNGGFQYRDGLTTATFIIYSRQNTGGGNHNVTIYFDGVAVDSYDAAIGGVNVGGYTSRSITLTGRGYTDHQIITVHISPVPNTVGDATKNIYYVVDAYVTPLSGITSTGTWPSVPSFGTVNASNLNQLSNAEDYLGNRLGNVPIPLSMGYVQWMGTNNPKYPDFRYFTVRLTNGNTRLKTNVFYRCQQTQAYIDVVINGTVFAQGPYTIGQQVLIQFDIDLAAAGLSNNVDYFGLIRERVTIAGSPGDGHGGYVFSRVDNGPLRMGANSYSISAPVTTSFINEPLTINQLQTRLNSIGSDISTTYSRITANPRVFDRGQMFRGRYGINQAQTTYWKTVFVPSIYRQGDILWVKGQGLKIGYGPVQLTAPKDDAKPNDLWEYKFQYEEDLLSDDKITQSYFYLDQFKGLYPDMRYYILGSDVHYAAEHLR